MKNHTVPSGHNSPGKPSMYVTRQEAKLMHRGVAAAAHANSTGNLLCKAHSPRLLMLESEIWLSLQPLEKTAASPTSTEMRIFLTLPFYLPCLYMFTTRQLYLHSQYISTQPWSSSMTTGAPMPPIHTSSPSSANIFFFLISRIHTVTFRMFSIVLFYSTPQNRRISQIGRDPKASWVPCLWFLPAFVFPSKHCILTSCAVMDMSWRNI